MSDRLDEWKFGFRLAGKAQKKKEERRKKKVKVKVFSYVIDNAFGGVFETSFA